MDNNKIIKNLSDSIKSECNRYVNGVCQTMTCLQRGGYKRGDPVDYSIATCEKDEQVVALCSLLDKIEQYENSI